MLSKKYFDDDVVTAAKKRIISLFDTGLNIVLSFSGGKDSIVLGDIVYNLLLQGKIKKEQLEVWFIDEEGMYDDVIELVKVWRRKFIEAGVVFKWFCLPVKHFNCLNTLEDEETFVCWDPLKKDCWIRPMPEFAIKDHPLLIPRKDNYQSWTTRVFHHTGQITIMGVRVSESVQRLRCAAVQRTIITDENKCKPIYDMTDKDVWLYIYKHNLDIPVAYENMYRTGTEINRLRISQFFSIDTAKSLVRMSEMYPDLMEKVTKREPNAYLCAMYWDTEMFGRNTKTRKKLESEKKDYKKLTYELLSNIDSLETENKRYIARIYKRLLVTRSGLITEKTFKDIYESIIKGDPKQRSVRAVFMRFTGNYMKENGNGQEQENQ